MVYVATKSIIVRNPDGSLLADIPAGSVVLKEFYDHIDPGMRKKCITTENKQIKPVAEVAPELEEEEVNTDDLDGLQDLNVAELRQMVLDNNVEVVGANRKGNLITALRAAGLMAG